MTARASARPFRFGIQANVAADRRSWQELARRAEAAGYDVLTMPDHFTDQLALGPALMCAADATTTLRIGSLVYDNDYRHPLLLAKELATLDVLSEGRVEIGLGAGWLRSDYEQTGIAYDPPAVRVERMMEALDVIRAALGPTPFTHHGTHYTVTDYDGRPKPMQTRPPVLIGGGGPRMLRFAARHADIVGINPNLASGAIDAGTMAGLDAGSVTAKIDIVREAAGERLAHLELNVRAFVVRVTDQRAKEAAYIGQAYGGSADDVLAAPYALIGTHPQIVEDLLARRDRWGISYVIVGAGDLDSFAPVVAELRGR